MDLDLAFKILEIDKSATLDEIKQQYRDLINIFHPDRFQHNSRLQQKADQKLKTINAAYDFLFIHIKDNKKIFNHEEYRIVVCNKCKVKNRIKKSDDIKSAVCGRCKKSLYSKSDDKDTFIYWFKAGCKFQKNKLFDEAVKSFKKALSIKQNHYVSYYRMGVSLYELGRYVDAEKSFLKAINIKETVKVWHDLAISLYKLGKHYEALKAFDKSINLKPTYDALKNKAMLLFRLGYHEESLFSFNIALEIKPNSPEIINFKNAHLSNFYQAEDDIPF